MPRSFDFSRTSTNRRWNILLIFPKKPLISPLWGQKFYYTQFGKTRNRDPLALVWLIIPQPKIDCKGYPNSVCAAGEPPKNRPQPDCRNGAWQHCRVCEDVRILRRYLWPEIIYLVPPRDVCVCGTALFGQTWGHSSLVNLGGKWSWWLFGLGFAS